MNISDSLYNMKRIVLLNLDQNVLENYLKIYHNYNNYNKMDKKKILNMKNSTYF